MRNVFSIKNIRRAAAAAEKGFTLLEMLVVLLIIGLLAGLIGPQLMGRVDISRQTAAETQSRMLKSALDTMRLDIGRYPTKEEGLAMLTVAPSDERIARKWRGPYLSEDLPADPWGTAYQYEPINANTVALYSLGADGKAGGEDINADVGLLPKTAADTATR
jgi:general secretion pathway protein G